MLLMRIMLILLSVNLMTAAWAESTARLRGPKEFDAPAVTRLGPLSAHDTLWRLAEQARPDKRVNMYQMMYALYQQNPDSFLEDNFNHLKPGAYLEVPALRTILAIDPVMAQRKSENDDRLWAEKIRKAAQQKTDDGAARQLDVAKAKQEITEELNRVEAVQAEQLSDLRERMSASMSNVETIVQENTALKKQLDTVVSELSNVKQQLDKDSEIQTQLQQLLAQQTEMLNQQREQIKKQQEGFNFATSWQELANSPAGWILAAALPAALVLLAVVFFIRRKSQKAAAAVSAATASPALDPNYKSPLPPLDDSLDFDESSLINLDDSLLNDNLGGAIRLDDDDFDRHVAKPRTPVFDADDLLDDHLELPGSGAKDAAFGLDDLLDDPLDDVLPEPAKADEHFDPDNILSDDALSDLLSAEEPFEAKKEFDPNNILAGNELSALFDNLADDDEDPDAIFQQALAAASSQSSDIAAPSAESLAVDDADDDLLPTTEVSAAALAYAAAEAAESDELLEEIELDLPGDEPIAASALDDADFDIDALVAQTQAEQTPAPVASAELTAAADDDFDIDDLLAMTQATAADHQSAAELMTEAEPDADAATSFDSSELEAFAESLADEHLADLPASAEEPGLLSETADEPLLTMPGSGSADELIADESFDIEELLSDEADDSGLMDELDEILNEVAELRAQSQQSKDSLASLQLPDEAVGLAASDFAEAEISPADIGQMLQEPDVPQHTMAQTDSSTHETSEADTADPLTSAFAEEPAEPATDLQTSSAENTDGADELISIDDLLEEAELAAESAAETEYLTEFADQQQLGSEMPDLLQSDDNSVSRMFDAIASVERPSKVLEEYPELQLDEQDLTQIFPDDPESVDVDAQGVTVVQAQEQQLGASDELNFDEVNFDELLSELNESPLAPEQPEADAQKAAEVLAELDELQQSQSRAEMDDEALLPDYVNIDKLLAATEEPHEQPDGLPALNIDVGLADFEDLIAADEAGDVDHADAGFAGQLDLVRAYIEIGDADSANHLIKEIMASDAPPHVKQEASSLLS